MSDWLIKILDAAEKRVDSAPWPVSDYVAGELSRLEQQSSPPERLELQRTSARTSPSRGASS
jgi:hypothetical protein